MRDNSYKQLIRDFDLTISDDLFSPNIETGEDYSIPGEIPLPVIYNTPFKTGIDSLKRHINH